MTTFFFSYTVEYTEWDFVSPFLLHFSDFLQPFIWVCFPSRHIKSRQKGLANESRHQDTMYVTPHPIGGDISNVVVYGMTENRSMNLSTCIYSDMKLLGGGSGGNQWLRHYYYIISSHDQKYKYLLILWVMTLNALQYAHMPLMHFDTFRCTENIIEDRLKFINNPNTTLVQFEYAIVIDRWFDIRLSY